MVKDSETRESTREKILTAACRVFAEKGYSGASVTEICKSAGANIAAISYYFGGKESLYQQAWQHAHDRIAAAVPPDGGVAPDRPAPERLRGRIRAALQRSLLDEATEFGIMRNEMASPTGLLHQVIKDTIQPLRTATQALLRELLGPASTEQDIELCEVCVVAPWMHLTHHRQARQHRGLGPIFDKENLDEMVDHFVAYALGGIKAVRNQIEARQADG